MKPRTFLFFLLALPVITSAQSKTKNTATPIENKQVSQPGNMDEAVYAKAISFGDYEVARVALFKMVVRYPDSLNYLDSLVTLYFSLGQMPQCILAGLQYIQRDTNNLSVMEMVALSYGQLSKNKEALEMYERMYRKTGNIYYAYQTAVQQFYLKRIGECNQMIDLILADPKAATEKITINIDQTTQQQVPVKAAALNMRGIIYKEMNMPDKAKAAFEEALVVMPDFALAKGNLDLLNKPAEVKNEQPASNPGADKKK
jgi:tetratricopeptide (TPR) repeat protein